VLYSIYRRSVASPAEIQRCGALIVVSIFQQEDCV
jgi:hypothetical protein